VFDGKNIYLYETFEEAAEHTSRDPKFRFEDLSLEPVQRMHGFSNINSQIDADDRRAERRAERERAAQS
jgi:hypothetical protein